jgi:hypothetical protein
MYHVVSVSAALSTSARPVCEWDGQGQAEVDGSDVIVTHLVGPKEEGSPSKVETELGVVQSDPKSELVTGSGGDSVVERFYGDVRRVSHS